MFYIGIEDLAVNVFIERMNQGNRLKTISYLKLEEYGDRVVHILEQNHQKATLVLSRDNTNAFLNTYSDFFEECVCTDGLGIRLKDNKTSTDLIQQFRGYPHKDILTIYTLCDILYI